MGSTAVEQVTGKGGSKTRFYQFYVRSSAIVWATTTTAMFIMPDAHPVVFL